MTDADLTAPLSDNATEAQTTELYRFFAADGPPNYGRLLYVGISIEAVRRMKQHRKNSEWMIGATRMTIERFLSREAAAQAEVNAIRTEYPAFNVTHAVDEDTRIRHYLAEISSLRAELDAARFSINREHGAHRPYRLSARRIASLISSGKPGLYGDGDNLYLKINRSGTSASWIFRYTFDGRCQRIGLGPLHTVTLKDARDRALKARQLLLSGIDLHADHAPRFTRRRRRRIEPAQTANESTAE